MKKEAGTISKLVLFTLLVFFVQIFLFRDILTYYYPTDDEFALLVHSTSVSGHLDPAEWFTIGFAKYFTVYPEWTPYYQNIFRPVVNIVYYINSLIFTDNYGFYLLFSYLLNGIAFALVYYISRRLLQLSENFSITAAILFLFNPGLLGKFYFFPSFAFDLFAAVVAGVVLLLMFKRKFVAALVIVSLGMFLKETMMFLPVALFLTYYIIQKSDGKEVNKALAYSYLLLPYVLWVGVRLGFGYVFQGASYTDHFTSPKFFGVTIIQSILSWPLGIPDKVDVIANFKSFISFSFEQVNLFYLFASFVNLFLNAMIVIYTIRFFRRKLYKEMNTWFLVILTWLFIYYIMLIVLGLETRFGETFYLLIIPLGLCLAISSYNHIIKYSSYLYIGLIAIYGLVGYFTILGGDEIQQRKISYKHSRELINLLRENANVSGDILLVNDITSGFGFESLRDFSGVRKKITKLNSLSIEDVNKQSVSGFNLLTQSTSDTGYIKVTLPEGTDFQFEGIDLTEFEHNEQQWFKRNDGLYYRFPGESVTGESKSTGSKTYDLSNEMEIKYLSPGRHAVIYFNPSSGKYEMTLL